MQQPYLPFPDLIREIPEIPPDSIVSRTLVANDHVKVILFGFAPGQELSEHTASVPASLYFLQGEADLKLGTNAAQAQPGTWVQMEAKLPHSIVAKTPVVMLLLMFQQKSPVQLVENP
jgi:quercetin dioxygenase-like cupin family protein